MESQESELSSNPFLQRESAQSSVTTHVSPLILNNIMSSPLKSLPNDKQLKNKQDFAKLSNQLTELLNQLSDIYTEIGYSRNDIQKNETSLFESVSATFDKFHHDSITFRDALITENTKTVERLRIILKIIRDPSGSRTIPDLYIRNLITKNQGEGSTLLGVRKNLDSSKTYILKDYRQRLMKFLKQAKILNELKSRVDRFMIDNDTIVPPIDTIIALENKIMSVEDPLDFYLLLSNDSQLLLESEEFNDLSDNRFILLNQTITQYKTELSNRLSKLKILAQKIVHLWKEMDIDYNNDYSMISERILAYQETDINGDFEASLCITDELNTLLGSLNEMREERVLLKKSFEDICEELWVKLKQDPSMVEKFRFDNRSLSLDSIESYDKESSRLEELKIIFMKDFVMEARVKIEELWDLLCYSEQQRLEFAPFSSESFDDHLLEQHEMEISKLNGKYELIKPLIDLVQQFKTLIVDKLNLEESSKDSSRLLVRNSHKILMEEERTRKRLTRQFPKVISELRNKLNEIEADGGCCSSYLGEEFLEQLDEQQRILESKGRRVRAASVVPSRAQSRQPSRATSRAPSRPVSRAPSRVPSRVTSRVSSPTKQPITTGSIPRSTSNGIQKPSSSFRKPVLGTRPALASSNSCNLPILSPNKSLGYSSDRLKDRKSPACLTRSQTSFQPQLTRLPEASLSSPKQRSRILTSKESTLNASPQRTKYGKIVTSPLKSLTTQNSEDKENDFVEQITSDEEESNDVANATYSHWREEQLKKLNASRTMQWSQDTF